MIGLTSDIADEVSFGTNNLMKWARTGFESTFSDWESHAPAAMLWPGARLLSPDRTEYSKTGDIVSGNGNNL